MRPKKMSNYLVDTTVIVDHLRGKSEATKFIEEFHPFISSVTEAELLEGVQSKQEVAIITKICGNLHPIPLTPYITQKSLELLRQFRLSHGLLFLDALIAASSLLNKFTFITANVKHFYFIPKLNVTGWEKLKKETL